MQVLGGYGGPKGMIVYCTGELTNNGKISMTKCGAYAEGQNVYIFKNSGVYEFVPSGGGTGGNGTDKVDSNWNADIFPGGNGSAGVNRQTGGGQRWLLMG